MGECHKAHFVPNMQMCDAPALVCIEHLLRVTSETQSMSAAVIMSPPRPFVQIGNKKGTIGFINHFTAF